MHRAALIVCAALTWTVGGCSPASPVTTAPTRPATTPSQGAVASPSPTERPRPTLPPHKKLEALLPGVLGDVTLAKLSLTGDQFLASSVTPEFRDVLERLGAGPEDVVFATASGRSGKTPLGISAVRIAGTTPERLMKEFRASQERTGSSTLSEATVGDSRVLKVEYPGPRALGPQYVYAKDDILFFVQTPDVKLAARAFAGLP